MEGYGAASCPDLALTFAVAAVRATAAAMTVNVGPLWSYEITLPPEPQSVGTARRFVRERLNVHQLPLLVDDVTLVASELATNALSHAGTPFTVTITAFADDVVLEVRDGGASRPNRVDAGLTPAWAVGWPSWTSCAATGVWSSTATSASPSGLRSSRCRPPVCQYQCGERDRNRSYALHGDPYTERM